MELSIILGLLIIITVGIVVFILKYIFRGEKQDIEENGIFIDSHVDVGDLSQQLSKESHSEKVSYEEIELSSVSMGESKFGTSMHTSAEMREDIHHSTDEEMIPKEKEKVQLPHEELGQYLAIEKNLSQQKYINMR